MWGSHRGLLVPPSPMMSLALQFLPLYLLLPAHDIAGSRHPLSNMLQRDPEISDLTPSLVWVWNGSGLSPHGPETDNSKRLVNFLRVITKRLVDIRVVQNAKFKAGFSYELRLCVSAMVLAEILHAVVYHTDHTKRIVSEFRNKRQWQIYEHAHEQSK